jgi:glutathione S-transferase
MIELIQFPWSPFCLPTRAMLNFSGVKFKIINVPPQERDFVWRLTKQKYYGVPTLRDGAKIIFDDTDDQQIVAKYLDKKFSLGLFPAKFEGVQSLLWRHIENEVEGCTFRLNDAQFREFVKPAEQLQYVRFKERKFGRGCIDQWRRDEKIWLQKLEAALAPYELMLAHSEFLLDVRPVFVDFDLLGMLENFLFSGHYTLSKNLPQLRRWHAQMKKVRQEK